ncbi:MAG: hypothetical protein FJZ56_03620 [Chlamydiae bacterium]|nr:hypothetical protein [Chlamydiota bacterium]
MKKLNLTLFFIVSLTSSLFCKNRDIQEEIVEDSSEEPCEHLMYKGSIKEPDSVSVGPYIAKKGAGAKITIRF